MKICDITQSYTTSSGGIRTYLQEKQKHINSNSQFKHILIYPGTMDDVYCKKNCKIYQIKSPVVPNCKPYHFTFRIDKVISILNREKPDIIELGSSYVLPYAAFYIRKMTNTPLVGFYHTDYPSAYIKPILERFFKLGTLGQRCAEKYVKYIYNKFDATITSSKVLEKKLLKIGVRRIHKIDLGVDLDLFHPGKRDDLWRQSMGLEKDDLMLIYSGRLDYEKRINVLLKSFMQISDQFSGQLVILGDGPLRAEAMEFSEKHKKMIVLPYQDDREKLAKILASADIYITAGPHETFGLSVIEAQASGLAVIGVRGGALIDRVPQNAGILGSTDSIDEMANNIIELSRNGYRSKGKNARTWVETEFSWERTFEKLFTLYEKLVKNKSSKNKFIN